MVLDAAGRGLQWRMKSVGSRKRADGKGGSQGGPRTGDIPVGNGIITHLCRYLKHIKKGL